MLLERVSIASLLDVVSNDLLKLNNILKSVPAARVQAQVVPKFPKFVYCRHRLSCARFQGEVCVPPEERAGQPDGHERRLQPRHVRPDGYSRVADPTRRQPTPQQPDTLHRRRHGRGARPRCPPSMSGTPRSWS